MAQDEFGLIERLEGRLLLSHMHVHHHAASATAATPDYVLYAPNGQVQPNALGSPSGLSPAQLRTAYGFDQVKFGSVVGDGTGQTIAIVDAYNDPNIVADLAAFDQQFGLAPPPSFTVIGQSGSTLLPGTDPAGRGNSWALETSLDVEWAHAAAPNAKIVLVEANSASDSNLYAAVNIARNYPGVSVVSMSWGGGEISGQSAYDQYFTTPAGHTGVTFVASSGDNGAYDPNTTTKDVSYPASSPNVLAVGGTTLNVNSAGTYISESGWGSGTTSGLNGGSGGGISRIVRQPTWQKGVVTQSTTYRAVPDVSMVADPASGVAVVDSYDFRTSPWIQIGGTSLAAPLWAGIVAVADQGRALAGQSSLDGATQTLPKIYALPTTDFHDIKTGNNGFAAGPGYDLVTGRGTPIVNLLAVDLAGTNSGTVAPVPVIGAMSVAPASVTAGTNVTLQATGVQETSGTIKSVAFYMQSPTGGADTFLGNGTQSGTTWTLTTSTTGLAAGGYTYYAIATDAANVDSAAAAATLTVIPPAPANDIFSSASVLSGMTISTLGGNIGATMQTGEPSNAGVAGGSSVWYNWTAPASGLVRLNTHGSDFDTTLGVYTGSTVSTLTTIAANDDDTANFTTTSAVAFSAVAGVTYHISVDGYQGAQGDIALNLTETVAPANDNFANATVLSGRSITWTGTNAGATRQTGEPRLVNNIGGSSVWFAWKAPVSGKVSLNTLGSNFDTMLGVYKGTSVSKLTLVASNDDAPSGYTYTSALTFNAVAGTTYYFAVDGYNGATGGIVLNLTQ